MRGRDWDVRRFSFVRHAWVDDRRWHATENSCANPVIPARALIMLFLMVATGLVGSVASAQDDEYLIKPADTSSPRATLKSFIDACNELHGQIQSKKYFNRQSPEHHPAAVRLLDCLDQRELPEFAREQAASEAAACLKEILDRVPLPPDEEIPDADSIEAGGEHEDLSRWRIPGTRITIARVEEGPRRHEYLFSPGTVGRSVDYYQDVKSMAYRKDGPEVSAGFYEWYTSSPGHPTVGAIVDQLPHWTRKDAFGIAIWKWTGLVIVLALSIALMVGTYWLQRAYADRVKRKTLLGYCLMILLPIGAMLVPIGFKYAVEHYLTIRGMPFYVFSFTANMTAILASIVVVFAACNRIAAVIISSPRISPQGLDAQLIRIIAKLLSLIIALVVFLAGGQYLGIPLTTLLAGAGVGGLAIALALQDTLKAVFGTIMLMADKPFRVGERIIFEKYDGVVEDIGLRSTRIRLLTGNQASIPNDQLARTDIENVGRRRHIRRVANIHIPLDTPREKMEKAVACIRAALEDHEGMDPEFPPRVFFYDFHPTSFSIRVIYWFNPPKYWDYLAFSEKINHEIFRAFEEQEIPFSLPFRVTYTDIESRQGPLEIRTTGRQDVVVDSQGGE
ncbi:MAG: mechanosensitive ion channel [Planctomycetes bacterium]|nr:mechanosensitive ion channel [Planctomycetota bacterium]